MGEVIDFCRKSHEAGPVEGREGVGTSESTLGQYALRVKKDPSNSRWPGGIDDLEF